MFDEESRKRFRKMSREWVVEREIVKKEWIKNDMSEKKETLKNDDYLLKIM